MDSRYVVNEGLAMGDRVVVEGLARAQDGAMVTPKPTMPPAPAANDAKGR
jgi:hypothetical protein